MSCKGADSLILHKNCTKSTCLSIVHGDGNEKLIQCRKEARACDEDNSNPIHVVVRSNQTKNFDDILTQLPDGLESDSHVKKVVNSMFTQTEISEGNDDVEVEGHIAQYHQCSELSDDVSGGSQSNFVGDDSVTKSSVGGVPMWR